MYAGPFVAIFNNMEMEETSDYRANYLVVSIHNPEETDEELFFQIHCIDKIVNHT